MSHPALVPFLTAALTLAACTESRALPAPGVEAQVKTVGTQPPGFDRRTGATVATATQAPGNAGIELAIQLPVRVLLATADDVARLGVTLRLATGGPGGALATQELQQSQLASGTATARFDGLQGGRYDLDVTALDVVGTQLGAASQEVQVNAGQTASVRMQLDLETPRPAALPRPSARPSGPDGGNLALAPLPTPRPIDAPTPTPEPSPGQQVVLLPSPSPRVSPSPLASAAPGALDYNGILAAGVKAGLVYPVQQPLLAAMLQRLPAPDHTGLDLALRAAPTQTQQVFILKALAAGESWATIEEYANDIKPLADADVIARSTMHADLDLVQQWQDSCGPAVVETAGGEYDPRYAFQLHTRYKVSVVDTVGVNKTLADQQKQWLEQYGGVAVPRGQAGGQPIGIISLLADRLTPITRVTYTAQDATGNLGAACEAMATALATGYAVPLRVVFTAENYGHFVVALAARGAVGQHEFQIHDSVSGKTAWVSQANIAAQNFSVFFNEPVSLSHYYQPAALP